MLNDTTYTAVAKSNRTQSIHHIKNKKYIYKPQYGGEIFIYKAYWMIIYEAKITIYNNLNRRATDPYSILISCSSNHVSIVK